MGFRLLLASLILSFGNVALAQVYRPDFDPAYRPDPSSDEGGFWYQVDKLELEIQASPYLIRDDRLNGYLREIVCDLAGEYCDSIRVYLIDNPHFNAGMYPNGLMMVNSGLLLRVENEAQLAAVLGHEIAHFLRSHQIKQWRSLRSSATAAVLLDVGITVLTGVSGIAQMGVIGAAQAYSRDHETEADLYGTQLLVETGYDPDQATRLWELVALEREKDDSKQNRSAFLASHPDIPDRLQNLRREAANYRAALVGKPDFKADRLLLYTSPHYFDFMKGHLQLQEYGQTEVLLDRHEQLGYPPVLVEFFRGELARLRRGEGDVDVAMSHYQRAVGMDSAPPVAYRELGYLQMKAGNFQSALHNFSSYLAAQPEASDHEMMRFYIQSLEQKQRKAGCRF